MATAASQTACFRPETAASGLSLSFSSRGASWDGRVATPVANGVEDLVDNHLILHMPMLGFECVSQLHGTTAATVVRFGELDPARSWSREGSREGSQESNATMPRNAGTYRILNYY